jgi:hypothetical protein
MATKTITLVMPHPVPPSPAAVPTWRVEVSGHRGDKDCQPVEQFTRHKRRGGSRQRSLPDGTTRRAPLGLSLGFRVNHAPDGIGHVLNRR